MNWALDRRGGGWLALSLPSHSESQVPAVLTEAEARAKGVERAGSLDFKPQEARGETTEDWEVKGKK